MSIKDIHMYKPEDSHKIIIDTNILIKEFWPLAAATDNKYTAVWEKIRDSKATLLLTSTQISEFINRCLRIQFEIYQKAQGVTLSYKRDYRETTDYKETMAAVLEIIKADILPRFTCISDRFDELNQKNLFSEGYSYDFNDAILAEIAKKEKAFILTDDGDFSNFAKKLNIITGNPLLLMMR